MNNKSAIYPVENARIIYRNFNGEARQYNNEGNRNFNVVLTSEQADEFSRNGFRVRTRPPRDENSEPQYLLPVNVSFKFRAPKIVVINGRNKVELTEETVGELDYADIECIDLTIRPYYWSRPNGDSGVKAYLNSMYVTVVRDQFADKYENIEGEDDPF